MSDLKNWTARPFPAAKVLEGRYCRLEPLDVARHGADLWAVMAGANSVWDYLPAAPPKDRAGYDAVLAELLKSSDLLFTLIDRADGKAKGHLKMMEIRPAHGVFEVGWITYSPAVQRTRAATEAVYLIGDYGFSLGYRRYEWKCNNRNEPSKRAAQRTHEPSAPRLCFCRPPASKFSGASQRSNAALRAGHSLSMIGNHAVSRFSPFTTWCWRNRPSYLKPKRCAARFEGSLRLLHFHS